MGWLSYAMANLGKVTAWIAAQGWTFTEMTEAQ